MTTNFESKITWKTTATGMARDIPKREQKEKRRLIYEMTLTKGEHKV